MDATAPRLSVEKGTFETWADENDGRKRRKLGRKGGSVACAVATRTRSPREGREQRSTGRCWK